MKWDVPVGAEEGTSWQVKGMKMESERWRRGMSSVLYPGFLLPVLVPGSRGRIKGRGTKKTGRPYGQDHRPGIARLIDGFAVLHPFPYHGNARMVLTCCTI